MADYQPMSVPSNYYDHSTAASLGFTDYRDNDSRKRKQRMSAIEPFDQDYQWQAGHLPSDVHSLQQQQQQQQQQPQQLQQEKHWSSSLEQGNMHSATLLSSQASFHANVEPPTQQSSSQVPFAFDDFRQDDAHSFFDGYKFEQPQLSYPHQTPQQNFTQQEQQQQQQQSTDPLHAILHSEDLDHRSFGSNSRPSFSDSQMHLTSWDSTLPCHQSPAPNRPSSHSTINSSNHTAFSPEGFLDSLPNEKQGNKTDFDAMKFGTIQDSSLASDKSISSSSGHIPNSSNGGMMLLTSQHHPTSISTGCTPPSSPATTMASTNSSPAITPMYGRLSNLSIRQQQPSTTIYHHHQHQQQQAPPLPSPTGLPYPTKANSISDIDAMLTINENSTYDSFPLMENHQAISGELLMDYQEQNPSPSVTNPTPVPSNNHQLTNPHHATPTNALRASLPPRNLHSVATARVIQQQATAAKLRPIIQQYLQSKDPMAMGEKTVIIMSSKVAQKSYGTEKRFLCPPPTAILVGSTWWTKKNKYPTSITTDPTNSKDDGDEQQLSSFQEGHGDTTSIVTPPKVTVCISGESSSQAGQIEWYSQSNTTVVGQTGFPRQHAQSLQTSTGMAASSSPDSIGSTPSHNTRFKSHSSTETKNNGGDWYHNPRADLVGGGRCVSKQLYINDADEKRKRVECLVKLHIQGQWMGTLAGKGIKVISKPSKKRQSVKNVELCIHHGSVVSLFNRIRSQTVSTKYLGVSNGTDSAFAYPGQTSTDQTKSNDGTCFVARTASWDPFVIWLVDTSRPPEQQWFRDEKSHSSHPEDYIGHRAFKPCVKYPPPPAIALRNNTQQPLAIHYNQHVVLQCLTTGLVSPVMIIRKVDKASTVVGGARSIDEPLLVNGGEYGDEILGDPVSQLHKIALQIVHDPSQATKQQQQQQQQYQQNTGTDLISGLMECMLPRQSAPVTYLACLNDMVGMHRSTEARQPILKTPPPPPPHQPASFLHDETIEEGGRVVRKRKVSAYGNPQQQPYSPSSLANNITTPDAFGGNFYGSTNSPAVSTAAPPRRRVNSYSDYGLHQQHVLQGSSSTSTVGSNSSWMNPRSRSVSIPENHYRRVSASSASSGSSSSTTSWINGPLGGAYWYEDVSDAAVWTLVGTDIASYTFLPPPPNHPDGVNDTMNDPFQCYQSPQPTQRSATSPSATVFPHLSHYSILQDEVLQLHGDNLARDLQVWLGDVKVPLVEYKSRELVICRLPSRLELMECVFTESYQSDASAPTSPASPLAPSGKANKTYYQLPLLLVKASDGIIHKTDLFYQF